MGVGVDVWQSFMMLRSRGCLLSVLPCQVLCGKWLTVGPLVCSVGVEVLWHGGLCELRCCVWRSSLRELHTSICRFWERVTLEVECPSSDREVELIALGNAEFDGVETVFESMRHIVCVCLRGLTAGVLFWSAI